MVFEHVFWKSLGHIQYLVAFINEENAVSNDKYVTTLKVYVTSFSNSVMISYEMFDL